MDLTQVRMSILPKQDRESARPIAEFTNAKSMTSERIHSSDFAR
jgi:hypothetical protein